MRQKNKNVERKTSAELETVFPGPVAYQLQVTDRNEFHRILLNRHYTYRTVFTGVTLCTASVAFSRDSYRSGTRCRLLATAGDRSYF